MNKAGEKCIKSTFKTNKSLSYRTLVKKVEMLPARQNPGNQRVQSTYSVDAVMCPPTLLVRSGWDFSRLGQGTADLHPIGNDGFVNEGAENALQ